MSFDWSLFRLCYVKDGTLWFTTQDVQKQWGDDWNDASYEHNAGSPYLWTPTVWSAEHKVWVPNSQPCYWLATLRYDTEGWYTPDIANGGQNSPYSVQMINAKKVPWLTNWNKWSTPTHERVFWAGTSMPVFISDFIKSGGVIWQPYCGDTLPYPAHVVKG